MKTNESSMTFGQRIRHLRQQKRILLKDFADMIGVAIATATSYEYDRTIPNVFIAADIASVLGVSLNSLLGRGD